MSHTMSFTQLKAQVAAGSIDTVLACLVDMQGRLMGKRFYAQHFIEHAYAETHCCNYLLATDLEMATPDGYAATSWQTGYGDYVMQPDLNTIRPIPWLEGTALVLCDILDHHTHAEIAHAPRSILKRQIQRLADLGYTAHMATELEFFLFENSYDTIRQKGFRKLKPISGYREDYHILQTTKEEPIMRRLRNQLAAAGIPVESSKGEAETGQEELNIRYDEPMQCADFHSIAKHATKEIAWQEGKAVTFLPKWNQHKVGSSAHVHQSLWTAAGEPAFYDANAEYGMSQTMRHYVAGLLQYAPDYTYFLAPYVNSYKRFSEGTFAPTKIVWSVDNRTAGFRLCGADSPSIRMECRICGSDINPYLALAALLAAGIKGIQEQRALPNHTSGDLYQATKAENIPTNLRDAIKALRTSSMLEEALGSDVHAHYIRAAQWEQQEFDKAVTDWEIARGFEQA